MFHYATLGYIIYFVLVIVNEQYKKQSFLKLLMAQTSEVFISADISLEQVHIEMSVFW